MYVHVCVGVWVGVCVSVCVCVHERVYFNLISIWNLDMYTWFCPIAAAALVTHRPTPRGHQMSLGNTYGSDVACQAEILLLYRAIMAEAASIIAALLARAAFRPEACIKEKTMMK